MRIRPKRCLPLIALVFVSLLWLNHSQAVAGISLQIESLDLPASAFNWSYAGETDGDLFGIAVHTAGDVNGDGFDDVIIGSPIYTDGVYKEGAAFVFHGGASGLKTSPNWIVGGGTQGARFGSSVSTAGDVNGDGYADVIVGADEYKLTFEGVSGEPKSGKVFVFHGSEDGLDSVPAWQVEAEAPFISLGGAVSAAGDVNNDGWDDIIVSAPYYDSSPEQSNEGIVYLYLGSAAGLSPEPAWTYECDQASALCGGSLDAAGDVNNDGYDDVLLGAPGCDGLTGDEGCAILFFGSALGLSETPDWTLVGDQAGANFGKSVAGAGDVNGDGYDDILVGAPLYTHDDTVPQSGAAFGYFGSPDGPGSSPEWVSYGEQTLSQYGFSLHTAGDVDQDGYNDVVVGSYRMGDNGDENSQPDEGWVYLFRGGFSGLDPFASWEAYGAKAEAWFGYSVGTAGDVDGDLADDLVLGSPKYKFDEKTLVGKAFATYSLDLDPRHTIYLPVIVGALGE